jgi:hypothetical protein
MALVLSGLTWNICLAYLDDVICYSNSFEGMCQNLQTVLNRFRESNLKLKPTKCKLFQKKVEFLGRVVSAEGLQISPAKTAIIEAQVFPKNVAELRAFVGLASYHRQFCPRFSDIVEPLLQCLRKGASFKCNEERLNAFNTLKRMLCEAPVLSLPRDEGQYILDVDASQFCASACLSQVQDGQAHVLEYASRTFNAHERNYCVTRKEKTALVFGLKQFRQYLLGHHFIARTDHGALTFFNKTPELSGQLARYIEFISQFDFELLYRAGKSHLNADGISRLPPCQVGPNNNPCRQCNKRMLSEHSPTDAGLVRSMTVETNLNSGPVYLADVINSIDRQNNSVPTVLSTAGDEQGGRIATSSSLTPHERPARVIRRPARYMDGADTGRAIDTTAGSEQQAATPETLTPSHDPIKRRRTATRARGRRRPTGKLLERTAPTAVELNVDGWTAKFLANEQRNDPDIGPAFQWNETGKPDWESVSADSSALRALYQQWDSIVKINGVLYRCFYNSNASVRYYQFIVPRSLRVAFLELIHSDLAGHLKFVKCLDHLTRRGWWYQYRRDLKLFISLCKKCNAYTRSNPPHQGKLQERWVVDLTGPYCTSGDGSKFIFTAICAFSKFVVTSTLKNKEATTVTKCIIENILLKFGLPFEILSDRGPEFENQIAHGLYEALGVSKIKSSAYKPSTSGQIEQYHRSLNTMLAKVISTNQADWHKFVPYVTFCYNACTQVSTGFSPYFLFHGREPKWNIDFILGHVEPSVKTVPQYTEDVLTTLETAYTVVRDNLRSVAQNASTSYNRNVKLKNFKVGDKVRVYNPHGVPGQSRKLQSFYRDVGIIVKKLNDVTFIVHCAAWKIDKVVHIDKLKLEIDFQT